MTATKPRTDADEQYRHLLADLGGQRMAAKVHKKRMLVVVNPYATTVSDRLKHLVIYALQSRYEVRAVETEHQNHATAIAQSVASDGVDLVVAFGGDGTVNEIANGLAGTDIPFAVLPGGSTNVFCRSLGISNDVVAATEQLLTLGAPENFKLRKIDLGRVNGRYFTFGSGIGIDADAVKEVDAHSKLKARLGEYYYVYWLLRTFYGYRGHPPCVRVLSDDGQDLAAATVVVQNCNPYSYFGHAPINVCQDVEIDSGTLSLAALTAVRQVDLATIATRLLGSPKITGHRKISHREHLTDVRVVGVNDPATGEPRPFPLHVDGDYIGLFSEANYSVHPAALSVLA